MSYATYLHSPCPIPVCLYVTYPASPACEGSTNPPAPRPPAPALPLPVPQRGLHHPSNPVKYVELTPAQEAEAKKAAAAKALRTANKPLTAVEQTLREDVLEKRVPRVYRMPKEKPAAMYEAQGKDASKWQTTLTGGLNFSMYPAHQVCALRAYVFVCVRVCVYVHIPQLCQHSSSPTTTYPP